MRRLNDAAMNESSLYFPSVSAICSFLKEMNRHNFVLLGKKSTLIAPFSAEEISVALQKYGAKLTVLPENIFTQPGMNKSFFLQA
jgi:hypothetical protein